MVSINQTPLILIDIDNKFNTYNEKNIFGFEYYLLFLKRSAVSKVEYNIINI